MSNLLHINLSKPERFVLRIECRGEFAGMEILGEEKRLLEAVNACRDGTVLFDYSTLTYIDSAGIGILYKCLKATQECRSKLVIMKPGSDIKKILCAAGLHKLVEILG